MRKSGQVYERPIFYPVIYVVYYLYIFNYEIARSFQAVLNGFEHVHRHEMRQLFCCLILVKQTIQCSYIIM